MRKLLLPGLLLCALIAACETKTPSGPSGNTPTTSTTTSSVPPTTTPTTTTSSSSTSTIVLGSLVRRYTAFQPPPNIPADMTLFFELIPALPVTAGAGGGGRQSVFGITENEYKVTGVFVMGNGTTGSVTGELGGSLNPLETGGDFKGALFATAPSGCNSQRDFNGTISAVNLNWTGGAVGTTNNPCSPNLLTAFNSMTMLRNDANAPLPTPPSTTSSTSTTTTPCSYSLSPTSDSVPSAGGTRSVAINTQAGCAWSAQTFAAFITVNPPFGGTGPATVTYNVAASTTARSGNLLIAGIQFPVVQSAPLTTTTTTSSSTTTTSVIPDLVAFSPIAPDFCRIDPSSGDLLVGVNNQGTGAAGGSTTRVVFAVPVGTAGGTVNVTTPGIPAGGPFVDVHFQIPGTCFQPDCNFTITVNADGAVTEGPQPAASQNNGATGICLGSIIGFRRRR